MDWDAVVAPAGGTLNGYYVERFAGSTPSAACATSPSSLTSATACNDTGVADGTYTYKVTAVFRSWTAQSAASNSVTVVNDTAAPTVSSINRAGANPTNATSVQWTVTFSEPVIGVDVSDFALVSTGTLSGGSVTNVSGSNSTYTATANTGTGEGTLRLDLVDNDTITDGVGNELGGAGAGNGDFTSGQVFVIDRTGPSVTVDQKSGQADPTNALPILWTVTFNEPVTGFDASDLTRGGTATGGNVAVTGSGATYEIALTNPGTNLSNGTISFTIAASKAQDAAGNDNTASTSTDNTVTYDTVPPSVTVNQKSGQPDPTNALPILWTVTFSEPVTGFDASDLTRGGTATGGTVGVTGSAGATDLPRRDAHQRDDQLRDRSQHGAGRCRQHNTASTSRTTRSPTTRWRRR